MLLWSSRPCKQPDWPGKAASAPFKPQETRRAETARLPHSWKTRRAGARRLLAGSNEKGAAGPDAGAVSRPRARGFPASLRAQRPGFLSPPKPCPRRLRPARRASSPHELHPSGAASLWSYWTRNSSSKDSPTRRMNGRKSARRPADPRWKRGSRAAFRPPGQPQRPLATGGVLCAV